MSQNDVTLSALADKYDGKTNDVFPEISAEVLIDVVASDTVQPDNVVATEVVADVVVSDTVQPDNVVATEVVADVVKPKKTRKPTGAPVGRPTDNEGKTTMGKARQIYASNPTFTNMQLRDAIMAQAGCKKQVASTYASLIINGKK